MSAEETVTWNEVCAKVGFRDNLYRTCREKVKEFPAGGFANGAFDEAPEPDFTRQLARTAKPIPKAPKVKKTDEPEEDEEALEGFFDAFPIQKLLVYGSVAAVAYFLLMRKPSPAAAPKTVAVTSSDASTAAPKAA